MSSDRVDTVDGRAPAASRWKTWLLVISLAFNVLILGAMAGRIWHVRHGGFAPGGEVTGTNIALFTARLPAERRQAVIAAVREERQALRPLRLDVRTARGGVRDAIAAEPFDAARVATAQMELLEAEVRMRKAAHQLIIKIGSVLTSEERRQFAAHIMAEGPKGGRRGPPGGWFNRQPPPEPPDTPKDAPSKDAIPPK